MRLYHREQPNNEDCEAQTLMQVGNNSTALRLNHRAGSGSDRVQLQDRQPTKGTGFLSNRAQSK
jgi:hypothetical protein